MRTPARLLLVFSSLLALASVGCGRASTPRIRVANDLGCSPDQTAVRKLAVDSPKRGYSRWEVTGCGRQALYVCTSRVRDCWREGDVHAQPVAPGEVPIP